MGVTLVNEMTSVEAKELMLKLQVMINQPHINITHPLPPLVSCVGDGITDNEANFNGLKSYAATNKLPLFVPVGTFLIGSGNLLSQGVVCFGASRSESIFKMKPNKNSDFFILANATDNLNGGCGLINLHLDGNKDYNTGTGWALLRVSGVCEGAVFHDLHLEDGYNGLSVEATPYFVWQYHFHDFLIEHCNGYGLDGLGTDNNFSHFTIGPCVLDCVRAAGANCRLDNFKIYGSRTASGFNVTGSRLQFNNIDAQESFMHGIHIVTGYDITITNLNCDNNGYNWPDTNSPRLPKATPDSYGVKIEAGLDITILAYNFSNRNASYKFGVGAYWVGMGAYNSQRIKIQLNHETNPYGVSFDGSTDGIDLFSPYKGLSIEKAASFTLSTTEFGKLVRINSASDVTVTLPNEASCVAGNIPRRSDATIFELYGTGRLIFASESGVVIQCITNTFSTRYSRVEAIRTHTDRWFVHGERNFGAGTAIPGTTGTLSITMDGNVKALTPTGDITLNGTGAVTGNEVTLVITTSGTTSYTITFGTNFKTIGTLVTGTVTGKVFTIKFICNGTTYYEVSRTTAM